VGVVEEGAVGEVEVEVQADLAAEVEQNVLLIGTVLDAVPPVVLEVNQLVLNAALQTRVREEEVMEALLEIMGTQGVLPTTDGHKKIMAPIITDDLTITAAGITMEIKVVITVEIVEVEDEDEEVGSERQIGTVMRAAQPVVLEADQIALSVAPRIQVRAEDHLLVVVVVDTEDLLQVAMEMATEMKWREIRESVLMIGIVSAVVQKEFSAADQIATSVMHRTRICQRQK